MTEPMNKEIERQRYEKKVDRRKIDGTENTEKEKRMSLKHVSLSNDRRRQTSAKSEVATFHYKMDFML